MGPRSRWVQVHKDLRSRQILGPDGPRFQADTKSRYIQDLGGSRILAGRQTPHLERPGMMAELGPGSIQGCGRASLLNQSLTQRSWGELPGSESTQDPCGPRLKMKIKAVRNLVLGSDPKGRRVVFQPL